MSGNLEQKSILMKYTPICSIGGSAGSVTALQQLFRQLPTDLGLAYVVILHLSPDQPSALSEVLSVCTRMPVFQIQDGPTLKPDCVYVIPPDRELVIEGDSVTARAFSEPRGRRAPIDMFFRSIAAARGDGIAVVLSGAGADGALGVRAVKEAGGVIMVQEPAEAGFASMPQNAIATGAADFVAPLARLAECLAEVAHSKEAVRSLDMDGSANDLRRIVAFLRVRTGHDFSSYKRATVMRRVVRRMQVCRTETLAAYADYLLATPEEAKELLSDLLISVTMFFRDPRAYEALERSAVKPIFDDLDPGRDEGIRAWVVGCATGEEAFSLAMLIHEEAARRKLQPQIQIFATDLDDGALATAREGRYPRSIEADVPEERLARFFTDEGTHYRVRKELRESVVFASHSVIKEPPFMRLDLITCRNLLIYLERTLQQQLCSIFHYGLKPGRFLFLGSAETADVAGELFMPLDREARVYCSRPHGSHVLPILPQFAAPEHLAGPDAPLLPRVERSHHPTALHASALERTAPPSVLVDDGQNIIHLSPSAGRFILLSAGPLSSLLPAIVRPELRLDLRLALTRALESREPTLTYPTNVAFDNDRRRVSMHVAPVPREANMGAQALVLFLDGSSVTDEVEDDAKPDTRTDEVRRLHVELKAAQEALVASRIGHDASIQDLRATNEELQSINEEYRSTAEELETSKEELQSINEELHTVNAELKSKLASISVAHSDLQNLTVAIEIGTLFLDPGLRIKMFTPAIATLFNVTKSDIGRIVTDFTHRLDYDTLETDVRRVLADLAPVETEVRSKSGSWFVVRLRPYRTVDDRIDGTVVTFVDITARRQAEAALRESEEQYRILFDSIDEGFCTIEMLFDPQGKPCDYRFLHANPAFEEQTGLSGAIGRTMRELVPNHEDYWYEVYGRIATTGEPARFENQAQALGRWYDVYAFRIGRPDERRVAVLFRDVLERKRAENALRESEERFRQFGEASQDVLWIRSADTFQWEYLTPAFETIYGLDRAAALRGDNMANWVDLILPEDRERAVGYIERVREGEWVTFEYRVLRPVDGQVRWLRNTDFPIKDDTGRVVRIGGVGHDISAMKAAEEALGVAEQRQRALIEGIPQLVWRSDEDGLWTWSSPQWRDYTGQTEDQSRGMGWLEVIHPDDRDTVTQVRQVARREGQFAVEYRVRRARDGAWRWHATRSVPLSDPAKADAAGDRILEWLGTTTDIDDLKRLQGQQEVLVAELQHRTRNLLAVVRSVARTSISPGHERDEYEGRLAAVSRVQGFLSQSSFHTVSLRDLVEAELAAAGEGASGRVSVDGPPVDLPGEGVQPVALALHELATNAIKYGAIAQPAGQLSVTWHVKGDNARGGMDTERRLLIDWHESGVAMPDGSTVKRQGYGTELITKALPYQLDAETALEFTPDGVRCRIILPASAFSHGEASE